jgi:hypothetical protein
MLKQRDGDAEVSKAEIEFYRVQKEDQSIRTSTGSIQPSQVQRTLLAQLSANISF